MKVNFFTTKHYALNPRNFFSKKGYRNGISFSNQKFSFPRENFLSADFSSTLLIPEIYLPIFQSKILQYKGVSRYISYLLEKYQIYIANGLIPSYSTVTTKYQAKGQNLQKIAFRPNPADWTELKLYRIAFGMSISAFLVYLVIADSIDFAETFSPYLKSVGISNTPKFDLVAKVFLLNKRSDYTIIYQHRKRRIH